MTTGSGVPDLSAFQLEVARLFFALPDSRGFLLAGGAALLAQHLTARPTEDLDFFTTPEHGHVLAARDALEAAASEHGWTARRIHDSDKFCRMVIRSADDGVLVDLAVNAPPDLPASASSAGPTLAPEELAGNKLLALVDRCRRPRLRRRVRTGASFRQGCPTRSGRPDRRRVRRQRARRNDRHSRAVHGRRTARA